jgi:hypothetical protein
MVCRLRRDDGGIGDERDVAGSRSAVLRQGRRDHLNCRRDRWPYWARRWRPVLSLATAGRAPCRRARPPLRAATARVDFADDRTGDTLFASLWGVTQQHTAWICLGWRGRIVDFGVAIVIEHPEDHRRPSLERRASERFSQRFTGRVSGSKSISLAPTSSAASHHRRAPMRGGPGSE